MPTKGDSSKKGKSGIPASVRASVVGLCLGGEPGQQEIAWKLWKERFQHAVAKGHDIRSVQEAQHSDIQIGCLFRP